MSLNDEALDIDLYQIRMLIAFYRAGMKNTTGTMDAFVRSMPANRKFLVVCGIERILNYLSELQITEEDIEVYKSILPEVEFDSDLRNYLTGLSFSQLDFRSMEEGEIAFANEPLLSISGPIGMVQFIEKKVLSILNHDVRIASKAARIFLAANGRPVAEFGGRRGGDKMSAEAARAAYIAGFSSTSNVLAFKRYGIPCLGTMGHLWPMSHLDSENDDGEARAFKNWHNIFKKSSYLVDTYNTIKGTEKVVDNVPRGSIESIRLDSGDLSNYSFLVRRLLMATDNVKTTIGATNDLNEYKIKELLDKGCSIDWFGCGTEVVSTPDSPSCGFVYKLVEVNDVEKGPVAVAKLSANGKATLPGKKHVFRNYNSNKNVYTHDTIDVFTNKPYQYDLLRPKNILRATCKDYDQMQTAGARANFLERIEKMPSYVKLITNADDLYYNVEFSEELRKAISSFKLNKQT